MKLSNIAVLALRGCSRDTKIKIAEALDISLNTLYRHINENKDNGELTKARAIQVIGEETGLNQPEILEETVEPIKES